MQRGGYGVASFEKNGTITDSMIIKVQITGERPHNLKESQLHE